MSILSTGVYDPKYHKSNLFLFTQTVDFRVPLRLSSLCSSIQALKYSRRISSAGLNTLSL